MCRSHLLDPALHQANQRRCIPLIFIYTTVSALFLENDPTHHSSQIALRESYSLLQFLFPSYTEHTLCLGAANSTCFIVGFVERASDASGRLCVTKSHGYTRSQVGQSCDWSSGARISGALGQCWCGYFRPPLE